MNWIKSEKIVHKWKKIYGEPDTTYTNGYLKIVRHLKDDVAEESGYGKVPEWNIFEIETGDYRDTAHPLWYAMQLADEWTKNELD